MSTNRKSSSLKIGVSLPFDVMYKGIEIEKEDENLLGKT
jgi:hypothetical protein